MQTIRFRRLAVLGTVALLGIAFSGCNSSSPGHATTAGTTVTVTEPQASGASPSSSLTIAPASAVVIAGRSLQLTAAAAGSSDTAVTWSIQEGAAGGSISSSGLYTAPHAGGTFHVVATSHADPSQTFVVPLTVPGTPLPAAGDPNWVKVTDYGAKGDGVTDDTAAFQAAAATGKNLLVPGTAAHYRISGRIIVRGSVMGDGSLPEIRMYGADGGRDNQHVIFEIDQYSGPGAVFAGLHLNGQWDGVSTAGEWSHCIQIQSSRNVTVENNWLERAYGDCVLVGGENFPTASQNIVIQYNRLENSYRCTIAIVYAQNVSIHDNSHVRSSTYVATIDIEPNPNGTDTDWDVGISNETFDVEGIAIQCYTFGGQSPQSGRVTIQGCSGRANWFFMKPAGTSDWTGITLNNNTYQGRRSTSTGTNSFVWVDTSSGNVVVTNNTVQPNGSGADLLQNISTGVQLVNNTWQGVGSYTVTVANAPSAQVSGNQFNGIKSSISP
jgi:hypothetical protein